MPNDKDSQLEMAEAEAIGAMLQSSGWAVAKRILLEYVADMENIHTIDVKDPDLSNVLRGRIMAATAFKEWLGDIEGRVNNLGRINTPLPTSSFVERR